MLCHLQVSFCLLPCLYCSHHHEKTKVRLSLAFRWLVLESTLLCATGNFSQQENLYIYSYVLTCTPSPEPASGRPESGSGMPEPASGRPEPGSGRPEPGSGRPEPGSGRPEPGSGRPEPVSGRPKPALRMPEPGYGGLGQAIQIIQKA